MGGQLLPSHGRINQVSSTRGELHRLAVARWEDPCLDTHREQVRYDDYRCSVPTRSGLEGATVHWHGHTNQPEPDTAPPSVNEPPDAGLLRGGLIAYKPSYTTSARKKSSGARPSGDAPRAALFQVISRRYQKGSIILTTNRNVASWGNTSSQTAPSPLPCWTGYSTAAWCSPFRATATGSAPTTPRPQNSDRKETTTRLTERPQGGEFR